MPDTEFVKCPQCGAIVRTSHPRYPECYRCGDFLRSHRYCEHLEPVTQECLHPEVVAEIEQKDPEARATIADLDERHKCTYFEPTIVLTVPTRFQRVIGPVFRVGVVTLIAATGMLLWFLRSMGGYEAVTEQANLRFQVVCPDTVDEGRPFTVQCVVDNLDEKEAAAIELRLNERLFGWFDMLDVSPGPEKMWVAGSGRYLLYSHLAGKSSLLIQFRMRCSDVGRYKLAIRMRAPGQYESEVMEYPIDVF